MIDPPNPKGEIEFFSAIWSQRMKLKKVLKIFQNPSFSVVNFIADRLLSSRACFLLGLLYNINKNELFLIYKNYLKII
jgi:hypothetical protein